LIHLAAFDFGLRRANKAQFAHAQRIVFIANRRPKRAALHGAGGVEVAGASGGIEHGARLVVGEVVEGLRMVRFREKKASFRVTGKVAGKTLARSLSALAHMCSNVWRSLLETSPKRFGVELRNGKDPNAARMASRLAGQPVAGADRGIGQCGVEDREECQGVGIEVKPLSQQPIPPFWQSERAMAYYERSLGKNVRFLLPSLKLKEPCSYGETVEHSVHTFLLKRFGGYTATAANVFGYWKEEDGAYTYGEHREFTVALPHDEGLAELKEFLGRMAGILGEKCLYVEVAGEAAVLYASGSNSDDYGRTLLESEQK